MLHSISVSAEASPSTIPPKRVDPRRFDELHRSMRVAIADMAEGTGKKEPVAAYNDQWRDIAVSVNVAADKLESELSTLQRSYRCLAEENKALRAAAQTESWLSSISTGGDNAGRPATAGPAALRRIYPVGVQSSSLCRSMPFASVNEVRYNTISIGFSRRADRQFTERMAHAYEVASKCAGSSIEEQSVLPAAAPAADNASATTSPAPGQSPSIQALPVPPSPQPEALRPSSPSSHHDLLTKLLDTLAHGSGTTVLTLTEMDDEAQSAMLRAAGEKGLLPLVALFATAIPCVLMLKDMTLDSASGVEWKAQLLQQKAVNGRTAQRRRMLGLPPPPGCRLNFVEDRPKGLLSFIHDNIPDSSFPSTSSSTSTKLGPNLDYSSSAHAATYFCTDGRERGGEWAQIDLRPWIFVVTAYAIASCHPIQQGPAPRSWDLYGSLTGTKWFKLAAHRNDSTISGDSDFGVWEVTEGIHPVCSIFRIVSTGVNSLGTQHLQISAIELFGRALICIPHRSFMQVASQYFGTGEVCAWEQQTARPNSLSAPAELPPEPVKKKAAKKKAKK